MSRSDEGTFTLGPEFTNALMGEVIRAVNEELSFAEDNGVPITAEVLSALAKNCLLRSLAATMASLEFLAAPGLEVAIDGVSPFTARISQDGKLRLLRR